MPYKDTKSPKAKASQKKRSAKYYDKNKEAFRKRNKKYANENKDVINEYHRKKYWEDPEKARARQNENYRKRKLNE